MENSKDKLQLTVRREMAAPVSTGVGRSTPLSAVTAGAAGSHLPRPADLNPYDSSSGPGGGAGPGVPPPPPGIPSLSFSLFLFLSILLSLSSFSSILFSFISFIFTAKKPERFRRTPTPSAKVLLPSLNSFVLFCCCGSVRSPERDGRSQFSRSLRQLLGQSTQLLQPESLRAATDARRKHRLPQPHDSAAAASAFTLRRQGFGRRTDAGRKQVTRSSDGRFAVSTRPGSQRRPRRRRCSAPTASAQKRR